MKSDYIINELDIKKYIDQVVDIETRNFPDPWPVSAFIEVWMWGYLIWGVFQSEILIGYLIAAKRKDKYHIVNLVIDKPYRRMGAGRDILQRLIKRATEEQVSELYLEVRRSNNTAIKLYESEGFVQSGEKPNYYLDSESALIFNHKIG